MKKLEDAVRRFGVPPQMPMDQMRRQIEQVYGRKLPPSDDVVLSDACNVKHRLYNRNLRLKCENNRLQALLNERDEEIDRLRNQKPLKWVCAALLVGAVFAAHHLGFM